MSKSIIFLVKSFLGNFYRHLAIFFWSHCLHVSYFFIFFCFTFLPFYSSTFDVRCQLKKSFFVKEILLLRWFTSPKSGPVQPVRQNFPLWRIFNVLGSFLAVYCDFCKFCEPTLAKCNAIRQILIVTNGQILSNICWQSGHTASRLLILHHHLTRTIYSNQQLWA